MYTIYLKFLVVEPGLKGLENSVLRKRALQPDQILNVRQPATAYLLNESLLAAPLPLRGWGSRLGGRGSRLGCHRSGKKMFLRNKSINF
jgi:hypothetical protein